MRRQRNPVLDGIKELINNLYYEGLVNPEG